MCESALFFKEKTLIFTIRISQIKKIFTCDRTLISIRLHLSTQLLYVYYLLLYFIYTLSPFSLSLIHRGRMIPEELEKLIIRHKKEGHLPFFVNCTTGTTVYGAFDPIEPIADICEKYGIWLHIDVRSLNP